MKQLSMKTLVGLRTLAVEMSKKHESDVYGENEMKLIVKEVDDYLAQLPAMPLSPESYSIKENDELTKRLEAALK